MRQYIGFLLILVLLTSCHRVKQMFGNSIYDEYKIEADNNTTEFDKECINEYNYSLSLADSLSIYFKSKDTCAFVNCIRRLNKKRYSASHVHDNHMEDLFNKNFVEIDKRLTKDGIPEEITYPISLKDKCGYIKIINGKISVDDIKSLTFKNIGCDSSGRLYHTLGRCWNKEETKVGVPETRKYITDNDGTYQIISSDAYWHEKVNHPGVGVIREKRKDTEPPLHQEESDESEEIK